MDETDPRIRLAIRLIAQWHSRDAGEAAVDFWQRQFPTDMRDKSELAEGFDFLGVEAFNAGDLDEAKEAFFALFLLRLAIVRELQDDRAAIGAFASAEDLLGVTLMETGQLSAAEELLGEAFRYREGLWQDAPGDAHAAYLYGVGLAHLGRLEAAKGDAVAARTLLSQAQDHLVEVDVRWPGVSFIGEALGDVTRRLNGLGPGA
ncbi:MAG: hypothetical protein P4L98_17470 [Ancalomicrobiaceae bacterium]|nr:hypothetical protein [Ancalomicrobiaceae bacterium]